MRSFELRSAKAALAVTLMIAPALGAPARAQTAPPPMAQAWPLDRAVQMIRRRVPLPALPPETLRVLSTDDIVGTVPEDRGDDAVLSTAVPSALTFEDGVPAESRSALLTGVPGSPAAAPMPDGLRARPEAGRGHAVPADRPAVAALPATSPPVLPPEPAVPATPAPAVPARPTPSPAATVPPPAAAPVVADTSPLGVALAGFAAAPVPGDSPAQVAERRSVRDAIVAAYAARGNAPLWGTNGRFGAAARSAMARLDHAAEDGLDLARYAVAAPREGADPAAAARAELALSEAVVAYGRQAGGARVNVGRLGLIDFRPEVSPADRILAAVSAAADPGEALRGFNPLQPGYAALRDKLAELRQQNPLEAARIPAGPVLRPGMADARVPLIRARFGLDVASVEPGTEPLVYDTRVAAAVAAFQRARGLPASGLLTPRTVALLSGGNPARLEATIIANMEMWRAMPRAIAADRVEVNIPDYTARVMRADAVVHETRVVVGQPDKPTPVFTEAMRFIIVNPYWNVPLSIIRNEMMPKLAADPNYFGNHGYEVVERDGVRFVRQPPGEGNALGRIKFMFPNSHAVYLHDTNARSYFSREMRALSHGCVRVEQPFAFAEAVLGADNGWSEARIRKLIGGKERTINLPTPLPVLITYFTAYVDPQTGFQLRDDVYGYTGRIKLALGLQG